MAIIKLDIDQEELHFMEVNSNIDEDTVLDLIGLAAPEKAFVCQFSSAPQYIFGRWAEKLNRNFKFNSKNQPQAKQEFLKQANHNIYNGQSLEYKKDYLIFVRV